jgi:hypothetical protein
VRDHIADVVQRFVAPARDTSTADSIALQGQVRWALTRAVDPSDLVVAAETCAQHATQAHNAGHVLALLVDQGLDDTEIVSSMTTERRSALHEQAISSVHDRDGWLQRAALARVVLLGATTRTEASVPRTRMLEDALRAPSDPRPVDPFEPTQHLDVAIHSQDGPAILGMIGCIALARGWPEALAAIHDAHLPSDLEAIVRTAAEPTHAIAPQLAPIARTLRACSSRPSRHAALLACSVVEAGRDRWWDYLRARQIAGSCSTIDADGVLFATEGPGLWWRHTSTAATLGLERETRGIGVARTGERFEVNGRRRRSRAASGDHLRFSGAADAPYDWLAGARIHVDVDDESGGTRAVELMVRGTTNGQPRTLTAE